MKQARSIAARASGQVFTAWLLLLSSLLLSFAPLLQAVQSSSVEDCPCCHLKGAKCHLKEHTSGTPGLAFSSGASCEDHCGQPCTGVQIAPLFNLASRRLFHVLPIARNSSGRFEGHRASSSFS